MAIRGRREPFPPIIQGLIRYAQAEPPVEPPIIGNQHVITKIAVAMATDRSHRREGSGVIYGRLPFAFVQPAIGKQEIVTHVSVHDTAIRFHTKDPRTVQVIRPRPRDPYRIPALVPYDPRTDTRSRAHEQVVQMILNELILNGQLKREPGTNARGTWQIGYIPEDVADWQNAAPINLADALNRIAAALKALGQSP